MAVKAVMEAGLKVCYFYGATSKARVFQAGPPRTIQTFK